MVRFLLPVFVVTIALTASAQTTVPNTFQDGNVASAGEANANFQALADAIDELAAAITPARTRFTYTTSSSVTHTTTWLFSKHRTVGRFNKVRDDTDIKIYWNSNVAYEDATSASWQIRLDDERVGTLEGTNAVFLSSFPVNADAASPAGLTVFFGDLPAGTYEVSIWVGADWIGNGPAVTREPGRSVGAELIVEEQRVIGRRPVIGGVVPIL